MNAPVAQQFGRYRLVRVLGQGGMGTVYLAEDDRLQRVVALKIPHFAEREDSRTLERFKREARLAAQLTHPNLCPVYDVDTVNGVHYLVMGYIEGAPLAHYLVPDRPWP